MQNRPGDAVVVTGSLVNRPACSNLPSPQQPATSSSLTSVLKPVFLITTITFSEMSPTATPASHPR